MAKKSKKAKRGTPARTKKRMKATRKKKPVSKPAAPVAPSREGFAGAKKEKKPLPKPASPPDAPSVWKGFGGKTEDH